MSKYKQQKTNNMKLELNSGEIKTIIHALDHLNTMESSNDYEEEQEWKVSLIGEDGTESPAPDGDITLEDGSTLTIKSGVVDKLFQLRLEIIEKIQKQSKITIPNLTR